MGRPILRQKLVLFFGDILNEGVSPKKHQKIFPILFRLYFWMGAEAF
jgi:hypothetical protein